MSIIKSDLSNVAILRTDGCEWLQISTVRKRQRKIPVQLRCLSVKQEYCSGMLYQWILVSFSVFTVIIL